MSNSAKLEERVEFKGLEQLLRKSYGDQKLKVTDFSATKLLPPGENYGSVMVKLEVKIKRGNSSMEEKLHLVAKTRNRDEKESFIDWPTVFLKEVFMYAELLPAYRDLERKMGIEDKDLINVLPGYVGHRNTLKVDEDVVDDDSLLLMENVKVQGYDSESRLKGLNVNFAKVALTYLARYHALGISLRKERPDFFFNKVVARTQELGINFTFCDLGFQGILKHFEEIPEFKKHLPVIKSSFENALGGKLFAYVPEEPWPTITHGDFWVNNILFHKDGRGNIDDVKFVDFHGYLYDSSLRDIPYFMCASLDEYTENNYFDDLLDVYYDAFVRTLKRMKCSVEMVSREAFDVELKKQAIRKFPLIAMVCKFIILEVDPNPKETSDFDALKVIGFNCSEGYKKRLMRLVDLYEKRRWF